MGKLTARFVASAKPGRHGDGDGLWLQVSASGRRRLVYRFSFNKKVTEMALGPPGLPPTRRASLWRLA
jgi:hypothetical protein